MLLIRHAMMMCLSLAAATLPAAELVFDFAGDQPGQMPAKFRSALAGEGAGAPGEWKIVLDDVPSVLAPFTPQAAATTGRRPVLAQVSRDRTDERFPILVYTGETFGDFTLSTRFKLVDGAREQMAGIAFRYVDEGNYYYIRASALGNTFNFFKVINGQRSAPIGNKVEIPRGVWHEMTIECQSTRIRARLNGREIFPELDDKSLASGRIGFWTKSDSVSYFADTKIVYKPRETLAQILVRETVLKYPRLLGVKIYAAVTNDSPLRTVASSEGSELGQLAPTEASRVLAERGFYYGKGEGIVSLTLPLHDSNGDKVAAVQVIMKSFIGQTEKNAVVRATPIVKGMEARIRSLNDLVQ
jgi:hypothetical protein